MANENRTYLSDRGIMLLYVGEPVSVPILTLENYTKWYSVFMIMPDGTVEKIPGNMITHILSKHKDAEISDHCFHPRLLYRLAEYYKGELHERAAEVAAGRWMNEAMQEDPYNFWDPSINQ
jgi:hypothetical protein